MNNIKYKLLLLEDDLILGESLKELLDNQFDTVWVKDGNEALEKTYNQLFDLYLLDVDVPFINGFELLKELRLSSDTTPCIFITAKIDTLSLSYGFDIGGDDYIKKPFDFKELVIRIDAQIRKSFNTQHNIINYGNLKYDIKTKNIYDNEIEIFLSPIEFRLFELFMKNIGRVISKEEIISHLHDGSYGSEASLRVQISKLKKIGLKIINQRSIGYKLLQV